MNQPHRRPPVEDEFDEPPVYRRDNGGKWVGWTAFAVLALIGLCFGAMAGVHWDKEVVKTVVATDKGEPKAQPQPQPEPKKNIAPSPEPKKNPEPAPEPKKNPEPMPEPKKNPEPEPKKNTEPEPKKNTEPEPKKSAEVAAVSFEKEIAPIFKAKCNLCHGDTKGVKGGLDLRSLMSIKKGGDSGDALVPGNLMKSLLWGTIEDGAMPPEGKAPLTDAEKMKIKNWILSGGK